MKTIVMKWVVPDKLFEIANAHFDTIIEEAHLEPEYFCYEWSDRDSLSAEREAYKDYIRFFKKDKKIIP